MKMERNFPIIPISLCRLRTKLANKIIFHEDIEELARLSGFKIADIKRLPLETGQGDENLYYILEKA
jgi:hypothetical protein